MTFLSGLSKPIRSTHVRYALRIPALSGLALASLTFSCRLIAGEPFVEHSQYLTSDAIRYVGMVTNSVYRIL